MKMIKAIFLICFLGIFFSSHLDDNYIIFQSDVIGHNNLYLNKINPFMQASITFGAIKMQSSLNNTPIARTIPNLNFIQNVDTSNIVSQFKYDRGDYAYRETDILVKNSVSDYSDFLFNIQGRKNPAYFDDDFDNIDEYVVQNILFDYTNTGNIDNKQSLFRLTKHYNKENSREDFFSESNNLGFEYAATSFSNSIYFNFTNLILSRNSQISSQDIDFEQISIDFEYKYKKYSFIKPFMKFSYEYLSKDLNYNLPEDVEELLKLENDLSSIELGATSEVYFLNFKQNIELGLKYAISNGIKLNSEVVFDSKTYYKSLMFRLKQFFSYDNMYGEYIHNYNFNILSAESNMNTFRLYSQNYLLAQIGWSHDNFSMILSSYDVCIKEDVLNFDNLIVNEDNLLVDPYNNDFDKSGNFMELALNYNHGLMLLLNPNSNRDIVEASINAFYYSDYSPIRKYRTLDLDFTFRQSIETLLNIDLELYMPYAGISISKLKFNDNYGFRTNLAAFVETESSNQIDYTLFDYEIGLIFNNFIISYKFINNSFINQNGYSFPSDTSDILKPIYAMKYLSVIWKFDN